MFRRILCSYCKTGKDTYELDSRSPICPYIGCYNGKKCSMYSELKQDKKNNANFRFSKKFCGSAV